MVSQGDVSNSIIELEPSRELRTKLVTNEGSRKFKDWLNATFLINESNISLN